MPNITFSVSDEIFNEIKNFPYIKWTELYRDTIRKVLDKLKTPSEMSVKEFLEDMKKSRYPLPEITIDDIVKNQKKVEELEWNRVF